MKNFIFVLITVLVLISPLHVLAAEPGNGTIEGRVINGTQDGSSVAALDITLKTYSKDTEVSSTSTKTESDGHFLFTGLLTDSEHVYILMVPFQQIVYYGEELTFGEKETTKFTEVEVYDVTTVNTAIKIGMAHTVIDATQDTLQVKEFLIFVNESDKAYIGSKKATPGQSVETLRFSLPKGATGLQYSEGLAEYSSQGNGVDIVDVTPVLPGYKEIAYSYKIKDSSGKYTFSRDVTYPTVKYNLLVKGATIETYSNRLIKGKPLDMGGALFEHLTANDLTSADTIVAEISNPQKSMTENPITIISIILAIVIILFATVIAARKMKLQPASTGTASNQSRERLLSQLAQLDNDFESRNISEELYQEKRAAVKEKLIDVMKRSSKRGSSK